MLHDLKDVTSWNILVFMLGVVTCVHAQWTGVVSAHCACTVSASAHTQWTGVVSAHPRLLVEFIQKSILGTCDKCDFASSRLRESDEVDVFVDVMPCGSCKNRHFG
jgi:hypothetical protein